MRARAAALVVLSALLLAGCNDSQSPPTAGPDTVPSSSVPLPPKTTAQPTATPSETPSAPSCIDTKLESLTLRQRAAQLIMTGMGANGMTSAQRSIIQKQKPGGVLLLGPGGSLAHTRTATAAATTAATVDGIRPLVAADQEGGQVQRLKGSGFTRIPAATVQGTWTSDKLTARATQWANQLKQAGVNTNLSPVADVVPASLKKQNAPIGGLDREFGNTPAEVSPPVQAFVRGMTAGGVITSVKHFPGIGRVRGNTDFSADVFDNVTVRSDDNLQPFADGIEAGSEMLMVSTVTYTKIDPKNRAAFSKTVIQGMIRDNLGYGGVVITDDVGAAANVAKVPAGQRATRVIAAGGDIVINGAADLTATMVNALVVKAQQDKEFAAQLDQSVRRVLALKQKHGLVTC
ncbi:glycoside hydrolase family 3 protein [Kribbella albertanoniae]|uniref:glycoside hydrolase family 3 N-terminal domain-containing protein n=1 Tax=Kribbella albertanoniae TaxID=1266829 RepID=UPI001EDD562B|nr:glycoside hydrolase family 3 N-terminal domain-containing protein [Kribbella albertanoniae]